MRSRLFCLWGILLIALFGCEQSDNTPPAKKSPATAPVISMQGQTLPAGWEHSFGYKISWLAIETDDTQTVTESLKLSALRPANWQMGVDEGYKDNKAYVTPPLKGWTLVVAWCLPDCSNRNHPNRIESLIKTLSTRFKTVQYFSNYRVVDYYSWALARNGEIVRGYGFGDGTTLWNTGKQTEGEVKLNFHFFDPESNEAKTPGYFDHKELRFPREDDVTEIAGQWSINPLKITESMVGDRVGMLGEWPKDK